MNTDEITQVAAAVADQLRLPQYMTAEDVAKNLCLEPNTVRAKAKSGEFPAIRLGKNWLFDPLKLRKYVESKVINCSGE